MSGRPYPEGIAEIRAQLRTMSALAIERTRLIDERKRIDLRLSAIADEDTKAWRAAFTLIGKMDVTYSGNLGYELRLSYFLRELVAPTEHPVPTPKAEVLQPAPCAIPPPPAPGYPAAHQVGASAPIPPMPLIAKWDNHG